MYKNLEKAIECIESGSTLAIGGFDLHRTPHAAIEEIIRQKKKNLTIVQVTCGISIDFLVAMGNVKKLITSYCGCEKYAPTSEIVREAYRKGLIKIENYSLLSMVLRYLAGSLGISFIPTRLLEHTSMVKENKLKYIICPYSKKSFLALPSLNPDLALIAVEYVDKKGNGVSSSYPFVDIDLLIARSSKQVILLAEKIISTEKLRVLSRKGYFFPNRNVCAFTVLRNFCKPNSHYPHYDIDKKMLMELTYYSHSISKFRKRVREKIWEG
jgi:acyl CoA:acetate/3-ketoacid CoA transferase alpha subunit